MALQGTIDSFPLVDVLGLLSASSKSGCLELTGDRGHGALWFRDGRIVAGGVEGHPTNGAADVVFELLLFEEASFEFMVGEEAESEAFESGVDAAVEQAEQMFEDWQQVRDVVPDLSVRITVVAEIGADEVTLSSQDWSLVAHCGASPTVAGVLRDLGLGEFEGCSRLAGLIDRGLLEVSEISEIPEISEFPESAEVNAGPDNAQGSLVPDAVVSPGATDAADRHSGAADVPLSDRFPEATSAARDSAGVPEMDFLDDDQSAVEADFPAGASTFGSSSRESEGARDAPTPTGFPEHFPIDDLVGSEEQVSFDTPPGVSNGAPAPQAFSADSTPAEAGSFQETGSFQQPGSYPEPAFTDVGEHAPVDERQLVPEHQEPGPNDDVLAQIGRLSPKAAEAIAAALDDGEDG